MEKKRIKKSLVMKIIAVILSIVGVLFLLSLIVSSRGVKYMVLQTVDQDPGLPQMEFGGALLHGEAFGNPENPTLIIVHGGPGWDYRSLLPLKALSDEYFVVFYDQRGTGLSPRVADDELTFEIYLADLDAIVDRFSPGGGAYLLGHSFGGMLVSSYVGRYPDKVAGVILAEPGPLTSEMAKHPNYKFPIGVKFPFHVTGSWIESLFYSGPDDHAKRDYFFGKYIGSYEGAGHPMSGYFCNQEASLEGLEHWRLGSGAFSKIPNTYPSSEEGQGFSFVEEVGEFKGEVLFLVGACDIILGEELQREQMKYFPSARMVIIEGVGHEMFVENPEALLIPVREYLLAQNH